MDEQTNHLPNEAGSPEVPDLGQGKGFGIRAASWIIDLVVVFLGNYAGGFVAGIFIGILLVIAGIEFTVVEEESQCLEYVAEIFMTLVYAVSFEWLYGATIGKLVLGMRVVKTDGNSCDLRAATVRGLYRFLDGLIFGLPAYFSMKETPHQRLGDKSAKTLVVSSSDPIIREKRNWWWLLVAATIYLVTAVFVTALIILPLIRSA